MLSILENIWNGIKFALGWVDKIIDWFSDFLDFALHIPVVIIKYISYLPTELIAITCICITVAIIALILGRRRA